jgi:hypothetical protein
MEKFGLEKRISEDSELGPEEIKTLFRGVWADELFSGQELPVGGTIFSDELTTKLRLDFENFDEELSGYTEENMKEVFESGENRKLYEEYLGSFNAEIDPYLHFVCFQIQRKISKLLEIDPVSKTNPKERNAMFENETPSLSQMKGKTMCAERAALAQYLLQRVGIESAYVGGVTSSAESDEKVESHGFVVIKNREGQTLIFDVARPHEGEDLPSIYETDEHFDYELLAGKYELLIGATEVLNNSRQYFGVGEAQIG